MFSRLCIVLQNSTRVFTKFLTVTGSLAFVAYSARPSAFGIYFTLIGQLTISTRSYSRVVLAGHRWFNRTFRCSLKSPIFSQPFHSHPCGWSCLLGRGRKSPDRDSICGSFSPSSSSVSELRGGIEQGEIDGSVGVNMDPYFEGSYAKLGTSSCKKCKEKIEKGALRLAKVRCVHKSNPIVALYVSFPFPKWSRAVNSPSL